MAAEPSPAGRARLASAPNRRHCLLTGTVVLLAVLHGTLPAVNSTAAADASRYVLSAAEAASFLPGKTIDSHSHSALVAATSTSDVVWIQRGPGVRVDALVLSSWLHFTWFVPNRRASRESILCIRHTTVASRRGLYRFAVIDDLYLDAYGQPLGGSKLELTPDAGPEGPWHASTENLTLGQWIERVDTQKPSAKFVAIAVAGYLADNPGVSPLASSDDPALEAIAQLTISEAASWVGGALIKKVAEKLNIVGYISDKVAKLLQKGASSEALELYKAWRAASSATQRLTLSDSLKSPDDLSYFNRRGLESLHLLVGPPTSLEGHWSATTSLGSLSFSIRGDEVDLTMAHPDRGVWAPPCHRKAEQQADEAEQAFEVELGEDFARWLGVRTSALQVQATRAWSGLRGALRITAGSDPRTRRLTIALPVASEVNGKFGLTPSTELEVQVVALQRIP